MKNKELFYLFFTNFAIFFTGMGLSPLLPLYAAQFGATPTIIGIYLGFVYVSIAAGAIVTNWLAERLTRKGLFVGAGVLGIPALVLLGHVTALWQLVILTGFVWFVGGIGLALVSVYTGLYATDKSRGKSFGLTYLALPVASVLGGTTVGQLVTWQGYPLMFVVLSVVWAGWPLVGLLGLKDEPAPAPAQPAPAPDRSPQRLARTFYLVLVVVLMSATTVYISRLGTSLSMHALNFSPGAITSTTAVGGLVTIPVTFLIGSLSDRLGRKGLLMLSYLLAAGGILILSVSSELWHFWLAAALPLVARSANGSVAAAFATDLLGAEAAGRGLPWLNTVSWLAGILGSTGAGYLMDAVGATSLYVIAAALSVVAAALLGLVSRPRLTGLRLRLTTEKQPACAAA